MPYPNEHACRLNNPDKYDRFARKNCERKVGSKCLDVIYGIKGNKAEMQALRYPKDVWDVASARSHCKDEGGSFEAASGGEEMVQLVRTKEAGGEYGPLREMALSEVIAWFKANSDAEGNVRDGIVLYGDVLLKAGDAKEDQEEELFEWMMSDYTLDRDLERIDPAGWDLKNYLKNPVVLWGHNPNIPAIGVSTSTKVKKGENDEGLLIGKIKFSSKEVDPFAWMIKEKIREGILRTGSVGFRPMKVEIVDHSDDDKNAKGKRDETRLIHRKQELYEFSIVNIPANPSAEVRREVEMTSTIATSGYAQVGPIGDNATVVTTTPLDGAWSVRGLGYKQQPGYVDVDHEAIRKELALINDAIAEIRKINLFPPPTYQITTTSTTDGEPEETVDDEPEEKAAAGVLADMALRVDDIEDQIKGLIERIGVAEPEPEQTASFYDELFKGSRPAPSPLDKLLNPSKNKNKE